MALSLTCEKTVSVKWHGPGQYREYRIPAVCVSKKGTVLIGYEARRESMNDWAAIDIAIWRSEDGGASFSERILTGQEPGDAITWNNPTWIVEKDVIHLLYCRNYERMYHTVSYDDGMTFSKPRDITPALMASPSHWNVCAVGPGHGIADNGGNLYAPIWLADGVTDPRDSRIRAHSPSVAGIIFSRDSGDTWEFGDLVSGLSDSSESGIGFTRSGDVLMNIRHSGTPMNRALSVFSVETATCRTPVFAKDLPDPVCCGGTVNLDDGSLLFSNCASDFMSGGADPGILQGHPRSNLCIHRSDDDGKTWENLLSVDREGGYSDLAAFGDRVFVVYEQTCDGQVRDMVLKRFLCREC